MPTMSPTELYDGTADLPGDQDRPDVPSADNTLPEPVALSAGIEGRIGYQVLEPMTAADRDFGVLEISAGHDTSAVDEVTADAEDNDLLRDSVDEPDLQDARVEEARGGVRAALDEEVEAAEGAGSGFGNPDIPTGGGGGGSGNGGEGKGPENDDPDEHHDGGEENEPTNTSVERPIPLKVPDNFGVPEDSTHHGRREVFGGTEILADGSEFRVSATILGDRSIGGRHQDGSPIQGVRVVGNALLIKDDRRVLQVEGLTMSFPYDTSDPELAAHGRDQKEGAWGASEPLARRTAEAAIAAMEAIRANQNAARNSGSAETEQQPDQVNEHTRLFITEILGAYPNIDKLTQTEGTEIAEGLLHAYESNWHGRSGRDIHARRENIKMAREIMAGRTRDEIAREREMEGWDVGSRLRSINKWMQNRPDSESGARRVRERLSEMLEAKTRQREG
jgi:hypothetical protein